MIKVHSFLVSGCALLGAPKKTGNPGGNPGQVATQMRRCVLPCRTGWGQTVAIKIAILLGYAFTLTTKGIFLTLIQRG